MGNTSSIEWMNLKAKAAKRRGDYEDFEYWRREYLNAQAARYQGRAGGKSRKGNRR